jgi:hypothetical protein
MISPAVTMSAHIFRTEVDLLPDLTFSLVFYIEKFALKFTFLSNPLRTWSHTHGDRDVVAAIVVAGLVAGASVLVAANGEANGQ